jgi:photoactive yellow protein
MAVTRVNIDADSIFGELGSLKPADLDLLPFGAIQLDPDGVVLAYNKSEEKLAAKRAEDVIGKNFFREIAPCTRVKRFYGAFQAGVERRELNEVFDFTFAFPHGAREVRIRMIYSAAPKPAVWIFVTPIA